ncbi:stage II sporulation protein R [Clostridium tetanomorphum]|uniref:Stage II sporulation protein R n=2 Tax=Clostridium tetanomorphum TaxID=1553 RepID=A0A923EEF5_CLOTT|nr:stage II sporulation protein R [Clostridium tetanomorphum]KAJ48900.1 stage II sporulation protein R [Clostridium tetanomorphum DSM 665]KAJ53288.1 stage II sporulation protein R [Clostridium tetanomorphum DSM 665]MBC2399408.1 stage II sporulation protein R [Clostridium tetanomorphum]MBP1865680.1 stage II sporulation protein R [Clostridium tetanomorphum]NRS86800.1 stage II sporulation protein R [Clostridium tetanomorphum]
MRKRIAIIIFLFILILGAFNVKSIKTSMQQKKVSEKLIRFHVIANSDLAKDQNLKLKVRDGVLKYMAPKLEKSKSIDESREIIKKNDKFIRQIAKKILNDNGYNYKIDTNLSYENFPIKTYGNITLPEGKYEAYRVIIGEGRGQNWWCVMFPPLCFVDITKGEVAYKETEEEMKSVLTENEYRFINNEKKSNNKKVKNDIKIKFKIFEVINNIFN